MLYKIDLFHADFIIFIVFRKKNEPMQLIFTFYLYICHAILSFAILFVQH